MVSIRTTFWRDGIGILNDNVGKWGESKIRNGNGSKFEISIAQQPDSQWVARFKQLGQALLCMRKKN